MMEKFYALEKREQHALIVCAVVVVLFSFYQLVWSPFNTSLANTKEQVVYQRNLLSFMKQAEKSWQPERKKTVLNNAGLLGLTSASLKHAIKSYPFELNQSASGDILLSFKEVPYTALLQWMKNFWARYQVGLVSADITPIQTPGLVRVQISFKAMS